MAYTVGGIRTQGQRMLETFLATMQDALGGATAGGTEAQALPNLIREWRELMTRWSGTAGLVALGTQAVVALLASAARTATISSADQSNTAKRGVLVILSLTAFTTAASLVVTIEKKKEDGTYAAILTGAAITALGKFVYVADTLTGAAAGAIDGAASEPLPETWRVTVTPGNANSCTYSVDALPF